MRFVPASFLQEGMALGETLYDHSHNILLSEGHQLTQSNINRIKELGYQGLYINTGLETIDTKKVKDIITNDIRMRAVEIIRDTFVVDHYDEVKIEIEEIVNKILDQLIGTDALLINLYNLKTYDNYTFEHSVHVTVLSLVIGICYDLSREKLFELGYGAIMHDIGKKFIHIDVLNKKEKLTKVEIDEIKEHPSKGAEFLKEYFNLNENIVNCALHHHERYDGGGYPQGLKEREISINGRIIAICDVFDALTSNRVYRKANFPHEAVEYIRAYSGTHFDPELVQIFINHVPPYPIGTTVKLSNGYIGIVTKNLPRRCHRPTVKVLRSNSHKIICQPYDLDLCDIHNVHITIVEVVNKLY